MKKLIITADEFGESGDINRAIIELFKDKCITNTVVFANMPCSDDAIILAKKHKIKVGIHFNLMQGKPLSDSNNVKSLVDKNGNFYKPFIFAAKYFLGLIKMDEIDVELRAQIKKINESGLKLTHFDGHCYIQMLPGILKIMMGLASEFQLNNTRFAHELWSYKKNGIMSLFSYNFLGRKLFASMFSKKIKSMLSQNNIRHTNNFYGIIIIDAKNPLESMMKTLNNLDNGNSELMVHPGLDNPKRKAEYDALKNSLFRNKIKDNGIELISYAEL